jgi:RHS repeat-associated protein
MATKRFFWSSVLDCVLQEQDGAGQTQVTYAHEPSLYGPLVSENRGGQASQYHFDALGSTRVLTDDTQAVSDTFAYDAWGNAVSSNGPDASPFKWVGNVGYHHDGSLSHCYIRARFYNARAGRWTSNDPIWFGILSGQYQYGEARPIRAIDPSGLRSISFRFGAFISNLHPGSPWFKEPGQLFRWFKGDDRGFGDPGTYRLVVRGQIESCNLRLVSGANEVGVSHFRDCYPTIEVEPWAPVNWNCGPVRSRQAELDEDIAHGSPYTSKCIGSFYSHASAGYPSSYAYGVIPVDTPNIDFFASFEFRADGDRVTGWVSGSHDQFPDYEAVVDGQLVYKYPSPYNGPGYGNLRSYNSVPFYADFEIDAPTDCEKCRGTCK